MNPGDSDFEAKVSLERERSGVVEEPPFRMLVLGDWSGDGPKPPLKDRKLFEIDRDNFDEVIAKLGVKLELEMDNGSSMPLEFRELDDFHPDYIFRRISLFGDLRDLRKRLNNEDSFYAAAREVRAMFPQESQPVNVETSDTPAEEPADNLLDAILTKPSGGAAAPKQKISSDLGNLIGDLVRPHLVSVDENERSGYVSAVDETLSALMRTILHQRKFQEMEAAWRALYFLVRRTETSSDLKIFILDVTKDELSDNLKSANSLAESVLYRHILKDALETPGGEPWAAVFGNFAFAPSIDDAATLMRISKIAAVANAPFTAHMRPDVVGVHSLAENADPARWKMTDDTEAGKLWAALRRQTESEFIGMTIPRFLTRLPYGSETEPLETFSFEEFADGPVHDQYVWANAAFIVAQLLGESYSSYGWGMDRQLKQDVEGLPLHVYKDGTETAFKPCSEVLLTDKAVDALMNYGLMPLVSYKNTDRVKLARFHSIADTKLKGMWNE
jgi:type VI secretion system protein ImpC